MTHYCDLHIHTEYTRGNGITKIPELLKKAKSYRMTALGIMDSGNIDGFNEFERHCNINNIKPVFGCGFYFAPLGLQDSTTHHLPLIAKNSNGLNNIRAMIDSGKRINTETLKRYSADLIALTGGTGGVIEKPLLAGNRELAIQNIDLLSETFGNNLYIELQNNGTEKNRIMLPELNKLSELKSIKMVVTGGSFYLNKGDSQYCNTIRKNNGNRELKGDGYYFKSPEEIKSIFYNFSNEIAETLNIVESIRYHL